MRLKPVLLGAVALTAASTPAHAQRVADVRAAFAAPPPALPAARAVAASDAGAIPALGLPPAVTSAGTRTVAPPASAPSDRAQQRAAPPGTPGLGAHLVVGTLLGAAAGLFVGTVARQNSSDCNDCFTGPSRYIPAISVVLGSLVGAVTGGVVYAVRRAVVAESPAPRPGLP
jgi:hypothetical protein